MPEVSITRQQKIHWMAHRLKLGGWPYVPGQKVDAQLAAAFLTALGHPTGTMVNPSLLNEAIQKELF